MQPKTWFIDIDGVLVDHNTDPKTGYGTGTTKLPGVDNFLASNIGPADKIILTTKRPESQRYDTLKMLENLSIRYDYILFELPRDRIVINDRTPWNHADTAHAMNLDRNVGFGEDEINFSRAKGWL